MQRLGQHFLKNRAALEKIAALVDPKAGEAVIEIGPGHGELTAELALSFKLRDVSKNPAKLILIERDGRLVEFLKSKFAANTNVEIVHDNALQTIPAITKSLELTAQSYSVVGNIPYYITGHLLRVIGELEVKPRRCVFLVQKEVAERICAIPKRMNPHTYLREKTRQVLKLDTDTSPSQLQDVPRAKKGSLNHSQVSVGMNRLAASVQFWAHAKIALSVPRGDFSPPPKVDSAVIILETKAKQLSQEDVDRYYRTVHALFQQPRKTIFNNLRSALPNITKDQILTFLKETRIKPNDRPQNLSLSDVVSISRFL